MRPYIRSSITQGQGEDLTLCWTSETHHAFLASKETLANASLLFHPKPNAPTCLMIDASDRAIGAVLQQWFESGWHSIAYFSKKLKPAETRYCAFDKELLAIYLAIKHFRHFIECQPGYSHLNRSHLL